MTAPSKLFSTSAIAAMVLTAFAFGQQRVRDEAFRPQFHFSPLKNWTNDPCGLVFAFGHFQLFFQHNPFANEWGHMSWGHAISPDLVHWKQLPVAIPENPDVAIFTGSSVLDVHNTSGLCSNVKGGCVVSVFTGYTPKHGSAPEHQTQNLAYSQNGVTWTKYVRNPVLDLGLSDTRDPKVFWYEPTHEWVLVMVFADEKHIAIFSSPDLKHWRKLSEFGPQGSASGQWECPDLYSLPVEGSQGKNKWVLKIGLNPGGPADGSGEQYFVGEFDGQRFRNDAAPEVKRWVDWGRDSYCELSFNDDPTGERHEMGWMNNWQYAANAPTSPWRGSMTIAKTLHLRQQGNGGVDLIQQPVSALQALREEHFHYEGGNISELNNRLNVWPHRSQTFELEMAVAPPVNGNVRLALLKGEGDETSLGYDAQTKQLYLDRRQNANVNFNSKFPSRTTAPILLTPGEKLTLHVFVDRSSVEAFAQDGRIVMTNLVYPKPDSIGIRFDTGNAVTVDVWRLRSIWQ